MGENVQLYRGPSIDASYQVSVNLAMRFQRRRFFRNRPIRNKNCLWRPCLLTDRDKICNLQRTFLPSFSLFGQAVSEETIYLNWPIKNKNCLWWPCLLTDQDKMCNLYRGTFHRCFLPNFSSFGQVVLEEKIKCGKLTDDKWWQKLTLPFARWAKNGKMKIL